MTQNKRRKDQLGPIQSILSLVITIFLATFPGQLEANPRKKLPSKQENQTRVLVQFDQSARIENEVESLNEKTGIQVIHVFKKAGKGAVLKCSRSRLQTIMQNQSSIHFEMDRKLTHVGVNQSKATTNRPEKSTKNIRRIGANSIDVPSQSLKEINIAVLDSEVDQKHPYLKQNVKRVVDLQSWSIPFTGGAGAPSHGTHVAGTIGGAPTKNGRQFSVAPGVKIYGVTVMPPEKAAWLGDIISGLNWVADDSRHEEIHAANMSLGMPDLLGIHNYTFLGHAVESVVENGTAVVAAAGNSGKNVDGYFSNAAPASFESSIAVSAINSWTDEFADFSNYGDPVDLTAPGVSVRSTVNSENGQPKMASWAGTSMAAPHVAGAIAVTEAMAKQQGRTLSNDQIPRLLKKTGEHPENGSWKNHPENGDEPLVDVENLFRSFR